MKRILFLLLIFQFYNKANSCLGTGNAYATSKSFFSVQPIFRPTSPEVVSIQRDQLKIYDDNKAIIDLTIYGGQSTNEEALARYFLPFGKSKVLVGEIGSEAVRNQNVDVIANYFDVLTGPAYLAGEPVSSAVGNYTFQSELSFRPKQTFFGAVLTYKHHISRFTDKGFWVEVVIPIEHVINDMNLCEKVITKGGDGGNDPQVPKGFVPSMKAAFKQKRWRFGKIDGKQSRTGVADPYVKAGYVYMKEETHHLNSYIGISLPTGNVPNGEFVFEPMVGNNGHATLFLGTGGGFRIWSQCEKTLNFEFDTLGTLYAQNEQTRSFDMKDKSWSRYMMVYLDKKATNTSSGINVFSKRVKVNPGTTRDLNSAFVYKQKGFQAEVGYHFFARSGEEVKLAKTWQKGPAIAAIVNSSNQEFIAGGQSRNNATINEYIRMRNDSKLENDSFDGTPVYREIEENDLDLESAAHPGIITHTGYFALSYNWDCRCYPMFLGAGGSYEFGTNNASLDRWMIWARFGISF